MKKIILIILLLPCFVKASSYIVVNTDNGIIIDGSNFNEVRSIASISKIMTAILAIESGKIDDEVTIGPVILESYGSGIYIKVGEKLKLKDLVYGLMLRSGNDAALAISEYVSGSVDEFINLMNEKAKSLGMKNTIFNNPSGLDNPKGNYSSCYDMSLLLTYCMKNETFKKITSTKRYKLKTNLNYYDWTNKNRLLHSYKYTTGGKTGYTEIARRTLITSASKNNVNLGIITLNYSDDFNFHKEKYEQYFKLYNNYNVLKRGKINILNEVKYNDYTFYLKNNYSCSLTNDEKDNIILHFKLFNKLDNKAGYVEVLLYDKVIHIEDIYYKKNKEWFKW